MTEKNNIEEKFETMEHEELVMLAQNGDSNAEEFLIRKYKDVLDKFPSQMSGGQKQRVAAARALISKPSIVLADEPTGALDSKNSKVLMDMLSAINKEQKKTIVMVTHNANAASYCSRILFIQDGRLFHELRKNIETETSESFYERIMTVMAQLGGGSANVL
jgi:putative ABC transport system ATP-binding protein